MKTFVALSMLFMTHNLASPALAQTAALQSEEDDSQICIAIGYGWRGAPEEIRNIRQTAVPDSFKTAKGGACGDAGVDSSYLIKWHLLYGTEDSVKQALGFVEKRGTASEAYGLKLDREATAAITNLEREFEDAFDAAYENDPDVFDSLKLDRYDKFVKNLISNSPSVSQLRTVKDGLNRGLLDRINLYLSAAEVFQSKRFLSQAQKLFELHQIVQKKMLSKRDGGSAERDSEIEQALELVQDSSRRYLTSMEIDLRLVVLHAQLEPAPEAFENVKKALTRYHRPVFDQVRGAAFGGGDDFCDLGEQGGDILIACKEESYFKTSAMAYGYADAMLAILADDSEMTYEKWKWQDYQTLHRKDMVHNEGQLRYLTGDNERIVNLKMALANRHFANAKAKKKGQWSYIEAWELLAELLPLVNPAQNPVRFRQIAEKALMIDAEIWKEDKEEGWKRRNVQLHSYYSLNLRNLDKLAGGTLSRKD